MGYIEDEKLKSILLEENIVSEISLKSYRGYNSSLIEYLLDNNIVSYEDMSTALSKHFSISSYELSIESVSSEAIVKLKSETVTKYSLLPFLVENNKLYIAMSNPFNDQAYEDIKLLSNSSIEVYFANPNNIKSLINHFYNVKSIDSMVENFKDNAISESIDNAPVVRIINVIINNAILVKASDIHIEPTETALRIRFRIDGSLKEQKIIDKQLADNITSRLKIMSGMDISITRHPQDGHFKQDSADDIDFRISTLPTIFGEKIVIRLIYKQGLIFDLEENAIGFFEDDIEDIRLLLQNSCGAILVTGPTGSGKTTTLSSFISYLNKEDVNIITIEDPVENIIEGVSQVGINKKIGLDFHNVLRSILRQDPDIIMVGEIRDSETALIAIRAAITGHIVFTTLHTNDALSSIVRLINMGVEDYFVTQAVRGIISQRLVRKLCENCKNEVVIQERIAEKLNIEQGTNIYEKVGCKSCFFTGYKGRFAVYEIIIMDVKLKSLIEKKVGFEEIKKILIQDGMVTIKDNAIKHLLNGNTSLEEIFKVIM